MRSNQKQLFIITAQISHLVGITYNIYTYLYFSLNCHFRLMFWPFLSFQFFQCIQHWVFLAISRWIIYHISFKLNAIISLILGSKCPSRNRGSGIENALIHDFISYMNIQSRPNCGWKFINANKLLNIIVNVVKISFSKDKSKNLLN